MPFAAAAPHEETGLLLLLRGEFEAAAEQLALGRRRHPDDNAGTEPSIMTELYALLAAAGGKSADLAARSRHWQEKMARRWCGAEAPDRRRLAQWVLFHNPFQSAARRDWLLGLLETAMDG